MSFNSKREKEKFFFIKIKQITVRSPTSPPPPTTLIRVAAVVDDCHEIIIPPKTQLPELHQEKKKEQIFALTAVSAQLQLSSFYSFSQGLDYFPFRQAMIEVHGNITSRSGDTV